MWFSMIQFLKSLCNICLRVILPMKMQGQCWDRFCSCFQGMWVIKHQIISVPCHRNLHATNTSTTRALQNTVGALSYKAQWENRYATSNFRQKRLWGSFVVITSNSKSILQQQFGENPGNDCCYYLTRGPLGPVSSKAMHLPTGYLCGWLAGWLAMWGFSRRADATMATASFAK